MDNKMKTIWFVKYNKIYLYDDGTVEFNPISNREPFHDWKEAKKHKDWLNEKNTKKYKTVLYSNIKITTKQ